MREVPRYEGLTLRPPLSTNTWRGPIGTKFGLMARFSESIREMESQRAGTLPNLRIGRTIFVGSDIGGHQATSRFTVYSFLLADLSACSGWIERSTNVRKAYLGDGRRMSFKNLNDRNRQRALNAFLDAGGAIRGIVVSVAVEKGVKLVDAVRPDSPETAKALSLWKPATLERLLVVVHWISLLLSGLSRSGQDVLWITDEDDIAANDAMLTELTALFVTVASHYLDHDLGHLSIGTSRSDNGSRELEDLLAIPDLVAGALAEALSRGSNNASIPSKGLLAPLPVLSRKTHRIVAWMSESNIHLKNLSCVITRGSTGAPIQSRWIRVYADRPRIALGYGPPATWRPLG